MLPCLRPCLRLARGLLVAQSKSLAAMCDRFGTEPLAKVCVANFMFGETTETLALPLHLLDLRPGLADPIAGREPTRAQTGTRTPSVGKGVEHHPGIQTPRCQPLRWEQGQGVHTPAPAG